MRNMGPPLTSRGAGKPARPPTVWTNRARFSETSGSARRTSNGTPGTTIAFGPRGNVRRADEAAPSVTGLDDLTVFDLDPPPQEIRLAEAVLVPELAEVGRRNLIRRRLVVVPHAELERKLR